MKKLFMFIVGIMLFAPAFATGVGANETTAPCDNATLSQYNGTTNLEIDWQPNTINVRWYDGEDQLSVQSAAQTCSYGGTLTLPSTRPTKKGYTFEGWTVVDVPAGYTKLEYIKSTGTQYIDTGYAYNHEETKTYVEFASTANTSQRKNLFGCSTSDKQYITGYIASLPSIEFYVGSGYKLSKDISDGAKHTVEIYTPAAINGTGYIKYDGVQKSYTKPTTTISGANMGIFTQIDKVTTSMAASRCGAFEVYRFTMIENGSLVFDGIPAKRNSDNELGMYDTVSGNFFTNSGTGTFIAGPNAR